jgi:formylglycine-generating enzyme required for sulfatase activity
MARIFVSYSRADRQFIEQFIPLIRRVYGNDSVWFDRDIVGGVNWWQMILSKIEQCDLFIYLISNESLESPYCRAELREALRLDKQILPVIVRSLKPPYPGNIEPDLAAVLRETQYIDMSGGFRDPVISAELYASINVLRDIVPQQPVIPRTPAPTPEPLVPDKKKTDTAIRATYIAGAFALLAAIIAGVFGLWQGVFTIQPPPTTAVAQVATAIPTRAATQTLTLTNTATFTLTNTPTVTYMPSLTLTPNVAAAAQTVIAQQTAQAIIDQATATAAHATEASIATQTQNAALTATATQWTATPSPDYTASVEALLTQWAIHTATQQSVDMTATATLWTDTPTATWTPSNTPTATATHSQTPKPTSTMTPSYTPTLRPEQLIQTPVQTNSDWTPYEHVFDGATMVLVPAGCFMMGSTDEQLDAAFEQCESDRGVGKCLRELFEDEQPVHEICFDEPFWIDKYEVTNEQYGGLGNSENCLEWSSEADQPRNCVTWFRARDFCATRDARLPTEAEWEYAARGPDGLVYSWGNDFIGDNAIYEDSPEYGEIKIAPVGSRPSDASWVGALDMSGNVSEWTSSLYEDYPYDAQDGRERDTGGNTDVVRVVRGGTLSGTAYFQRAAHRSSWTLRNVGSVLNRGFRCARSYE